MVEHVAQAAQETRSKKLSSLKGLLSEPSPVSKKMLPLLGIA